MHFRWMKSTLINAFWKIIHTQYLKGVIFIRYSSSLLNKESPEPPYDNKQKIRPVWSVFTVRSMGS